MRCDQCRFWDNSHPVPQHLAELYPCRRKAPTVVSISNKDRGWTDTAWPHTGPGEWCGEFAPKGNPSEDTREYLDAISNGARI